ncbi:hypothetical protein [Jeotgalibacillus marinus]|uniref:t-SNARE coiled-coil homology domain-containing protein n=1 Tax=Jeotgalibacillus marinus TaxID=86667 RepID=A0ABV3Q5J3_9BACL
MVGKMEQDFRELNERINGINEKMDQEFRSDIKQVRQELHETNERLDALQKDIAAPTNYRLLKLNKA